MAQHSKTLWAGVHYEAYVGTPRGRFSFVPGLGIHTRRIALRLGRVHPAGADTSLVSAFPKLANGIPPEKRRH